MFPWSRRNKYKRKCDYASVSKSLCASLCACLLYVFHCCSGYSICQANLNDLVGSEMCHKGALMDEGEHGANDTTTSTRLHSHLMKALTPEAATFNGVCHCQTARRSHASTSEVQMAF